MSTEVRKNSQISQDSNFILKPINEEEVSLIVKDLYNKNNYIIDPHSAVGYLGLKSYLANHTTNANGIFLSTAHPIKFKEHVEKSIGKEITLPSRLNKIIDKKKSTIEIDSYSDLKDQLLSTVN